MPNQPLVATCKDCGLQVEVHPPHLPASGGSASFRDDPARGWEVLEYVCGSCRETRPRTWKCPRCPGTGAVWSNFCSTCHHERPDPLPYVPDPDVLAKEERERKRERDALVAEWDREFPGWRSASLGPRERL